ncbi:MAG: MaoC family dehydratase [Rhizobiales bacterium]|nr:MaoC family dehydratase [Hyphomicrobiales bacterium]NRB13290.1 MaoC family dehydratase [Hyphomicrobiales bacterium]
MKTVSLTELESQNGQEVGISEWIEIPQSMIDRFAKATLDDQFIHLDSARARAETFLDGSIAHGFLTLSLSSKMAMQCLPHIKNSVMTFNYGCDKLRFINPVYAGSRVRGRYLQTKIERKSDKQLIVHHTLTVEIEAKTRPALVAEWQTMYFMA